MGKKKTKVTRYRRTFDIQIQYIILAIIAIYFVVILVDYLNSDRVKMYEVVQADIAEDNTYTGLVLRNETVYYTDRDGYINYYAHKGDKVAKGDNVYTLDETGEVYETLKNAHTEQVLSKEDNTKMRTVIAAYRKEFDSADYSIVEDYKYDLKSVLMNLSGVDMVSDLKDISDRKSLAEGFHVIKSDKSGVISYHTDSMESLTREKVTADLFEDTAKETVQEKEDSEKTAKGTPVYKLVDSEYWTVIIPLSDEQYSRLKTEEKVSVLFKRDNIRTNAMVQTFKTGDSYFAELAFDKYMVRYIDERYLKVEVTFYEKSTAEQEDDILKGKGLKIPVSAILEKEFLLIPKEYLVEEGSSTVSVIKEYVDKENEISFQKIELSLCYKNDNYVFVDSEDLQTGDRLKSPDKSNDQLYVYGTDKETLEGVYNINKGYAVFNVIERLTENSEYVIVKQNTVNGLSVFDRIALDKDTIEESSLVR